MNAMDKIAKGASFIFIGILFSKVMNYLYRVILARYLGPADFGILSLGFAILGVIATLCLLGIPQGIVRFVSYYKGKDDNASINGIISTAFKFIVPLSLIFGVLIFLLSDWMAITFFSKPSLGLVLRVLAFALPLMVLLNITDKIVVAFQKVQYNIISINIFENIVKVGLTFVFLLTGLGLAWVASAYVFSLFCGFVLLFWFLQKKVYRLEVGSEKRDVSKRLFKFSLPLLFTELFVSLLLWTDTLILGHFLQSEWIGIYNIAAPTAMLVYIVPTTIRIMFYPVISEEYAKKNHIVKLYKSVTNFILFLTLPVAVFLILFSKEFLGIFFGADYVVGYWVLIIICIAYFIFALVNTAHVMLFVLKKTKLVLLNTAVAVVLNICLNIYLIPKYGIEGAALATGISLVVRGILIFIESVYFMKVSPFVWRSVVPFIVVLVPGFVFYLLRDYIVNFGYLFFGSLIFGVMYLLILFLVGFFGKEEYELFSRIPFLRWLKVK